MSDKIDDLPVDKKSDITEGEQRVLDTLFKNKSRVSKIVSELKDAIIAGLLFMVLSLTQVDNLIKSFCSMADTSYCVLLAIKGVIFVILFYLLKNFAYMRKS